MYHSYAQQSTRKGLCIAHAGFLWYWNKKKGAVMFVDYYQHIAHAYYVPDLNILEARALNQADNGFEGYPPLTVDEVLTHGQVLDESQILYAIRVYTMFHNIDPKDAFSASPQSLP